ncbi:hypothetical protein GCM10009564_24360 [Streptomyces thermogriseus]|uniref:Integral membrane protein n=2 Tax=Streptomyces thermogriseus TaxID=75292 RepID=A0ABN1SYH5_9ACTN
MQTMDVSTASSQGAATERPGPGRDLSPLLAGAATAVGGTGVLLALTGSDSVLRGPLTLFLLVAAPAAALAATLRGLDPFSRALVSVAGAVVLDMLVAQGMLTLHRWSVSGGLTAVTAFNSLVLLLVLVRRRCGRTAKRQGS